MLTATDRLSHTTTYTYDNLHRRLTVTNANSEVTAYTYDSVGNLLTLTDPDSNTTTWTYDGLNRQITDTNELSETRSFEYDKVGNLKKKTDRLARAIEYTYDHLYRRTAEVWKTGGSTIRTLSFGFDAAGQLTSASDPAASYDYVYDQLGRVRSIDGRTELLVPVVLDCADAPSAIASLFDERLYLVSHPPWATWRKPDRSFRLFRIFWCGEVRREMLRGG